MKENIIRSFLNKEKLLTPDALQLLSAEDVEINLEKYSDIVISMHDIKNSITTKTTKQKFSVISTIAAKKSEISVEDFAKFYRTKYEKMRDILTGRLPKNFISLNKLDNFRNEVYVIGMVKEIRENENKKIIELEDLTASLPIIFEEGIGDTEIDDVIAVRAVATKNVLFGKQIIYPDVPLRQPATTNGKACFISNLHIDEAPKQDIERFFTWFEEQNIPYLFVAGDIGDRADFEKFVLKYCTNSTVFVIPGEKDSEEEYPQTPLIFNSSGIVSLSNPAMVDISGLKILMIHNFKISMLQKRYLGKSKQILDEDRLVLIDVPDIVCFGHSEDPEIINYKSITAVNSGSTLAEFKPVVIDFSTRDAQHITI